MYTVCAVFDSNNNNQDRRTVEPDRHCYKCNSYQPIKGGGILKDTRNRRRFVCAGCCALISVPGKKGPSKP